MTLSRSAALRPFLLVGKGLSFSQDFCTIPAVPSLHLLPLPVGFTFEPPHRRLACESIKGSVEQCEGGYLVSFLLSFMSTVKEYVLELGDQKMTFQTGLLANQANASIICRMGDTVVMSNCTVSAKARDNVDFLPLQVVYQEKFYAGGKIGGSRVRKREGRPADDYGLLARVIDRGLRPMFPKHMHNDIQVFCTVLSYDFEHEHDIAAANAAALAV